MSDWEVEGFIERLSCRTDTNSERLVLEAISHLRAFAEDCDALRDRNREMADEIERLQAAKRAALKIADERSKENVDLRKENERLRAELKEARGEQP